MKYQETKDYSFLLDDNYFIYDHQEDNDELHIYIKSRRRSCRCPVCGEESDSRHSTYHRVLQDTPIHCKRTYLHVNIFCFECRNPQCECKMFAECLPFAKASQVRTDALNALILGVSMFLSNEGASRVLALLGVKVSNDTVQKIYDRIAFVDNPDVEAIGVDDVAIRKGRAYATAVYDLESHRLLALLEGRDGQPFKEWLEKHPKIRVVARDRASAYATAIHEALPQCVQVADRFHLLQNLIERLSEIFRDELPPEIYIRNGEALDKAPEKVSAIELVDDEKLDAYHYDDTPPVDENGNEILFDKRRKCRGEESQYKKQDERRKKKQETIRKLREYWNRGGQKTLKQAAQRFGVTSETAKKYINMTEEEIQALDNPAPRAKKPTVMDGYYNIVYKMLADGIGYKEIYAYIRKMGYNGNVNAAFKYIRSMDKNNFPDRKAESPLGYKKKVHTGRHRDQTGGSAERDPDQKPASDKG